MMMRVLIIAQRAGTGLAEVRRSTMLCLTTLNPSPYRHYEFEGSCQCKTCQQRMCHSRYQISMQGRQHAQ
jgi:hypothetical protein